MKQRDLLDNIRQTLYMYLHDRQTMTQEEHEAGMQAVIDQIDGMLENE